MKKIIVLCSIFVLFLACNQRGSDTKKPEPLPPPPPPPKELIKTVDNVSFKMIRVEAVKKTTLGYGIPANERLVTLSAYYIAETEVTQELYRAVTGVNPSYFDGSAGKQPAEGEVQEKRPVDQVNWYEAALFCNKLTEKIMGSNAECVYTITDIQGKNNKIDEAKVAWDFSKKGFRLPTEAEWEYAAKGGIENIVYAGGNLKIGEKEDKAHTDLNTLAWFNKNSGKITHEVAKKQPNGYGLYDMSGNVIEWCNDYYVRPVLGNVERDPQGPTVPQAYRTMKGGGHDYGGYLECVVSNRKSTLPKQHENDRGIRMVCRL